MVLSQSETSVLAHILARMGFSLNVANGSLVADIQGTNLGLSGGGAGFADTYVSPFNLGWHLSRAAVNVGYAFVAPTGRFVAGASDNVGSGYWGNNFTSGATVYLTKNKGTSANLYTDWEIHGKNEDRSGNRADAGAGPPSEEGYEPVAAGRSGGIRPMAGQQ